MWDRVYHSYPQKRAVRILLECILVSSFVHNLRHMCAWEEPEVIIDIRLR